MSRKRKVPVDVQAELAAIGHAVLFGTPGGDRTFPGLIPLENGYWKRVAEAAQQPNELLQDLPWKKAKP
jgi:hypothetical protein